MLVSISLPVNDGILLYGWEPNTGTSVRETAVAAHRHITGEPRMMIPCYDSTTRAVRKSDSSQAEKERRAGSPRQLSRWPAVRVRRRALFGRIDSWAIALGTVPLQIDIGGQHGKPSI